MPPIAIAILPEWVDRVDAIYRELLYRETWRDYHRQVTRHLRGEPVRDEDDVAFDYGAEM